MAYKHLQDFVETLERRRELVRITERVSPRLEITEITDRISKQYGPALLFENTGYDFPLLINSMGNYKRICLALGVNDLEDIRQEIEELFKKLIGVKQKGIMEKLATLTLLGKMSSWIPKIISGKGACQQVVMQKPDITRFPILTCWPEDGGPFITLPIVHTKDPHTGVRNVGMYRMQVFGPCLTGMHWHKHKVAARHFDEYKKMKQKMPVVVALGGDPAYTYSATAPLPDGIDEYMLAGFLRKKQVKLVQCLTQDLQAPEDADIIIEGYVDPQEDFILEGPFGDHTGYYSLADYYPRFHITCITHRKNAIYPATIVGIPPQEDAWIGKATERIFLAPLKMATAPEILDMALPMEGVFHNIVIVKIKKDYPGQAGKIMNALWGAGQMMFTKIMIVVNGNVNIHDHQDLARHVSTYTDPGKDIHFFRGPMDVLDHSSPQLAFGGKMGIDATKKLPEEKANQEESLSFDVHAIKTELLREFSEIKRINCSLLELGISLIFVCMQKERKNHVKHLNEKIFKQDYMQGVKAIIYLDQTVSIDHIGDAIWRFANNIDPKRDSFVLESLHERYSHIGLDGTRKTKELDNFTREWPNILVSNQETIDKIDKIWDKLNLGKRIESPSLRYLPQIYPGGAMVD